MDPVANPYTPNAGSRPPELAGRERELEQFETLVGRLKRGATEQSMVVRGLRGVGKTVLLNAFEDQAEAAGFITFYHELTPDSNLVDEVARDAERALGRLDLGRKLTNRIRAALGHLKTIRLTGPDGFGLAVDLGGADEGTIAADLTDLFLELGAAARGQETGVAIFLDELQFVDEIQYRSLISALHRATQKELPIAVAAAALPQIPLLTGEARSYAERLFDFPSIENLDEASATLALVEPARRQAIEYQPDAVSLALEWTAGYPFYIQQLGKHAWNLAAESPITDDDVKRAIPAAQAALDKSIYEVRAQRATEGERRYMRAMAELGDGPYRSGRAAEKAGLSVTQASPTRQQLMTKGLIYATEDFGFVDFTVPRFAEFMRRYMPYQAPG
ncbi:MAG TPA: ATP-binding protein [Solirubrobacterales bacterium]|nr:ATP-binding protein [Solirubrobacterales bacterium]